MTTLSNVVGKISPVLGSILGAFVPGGSLIVSAIANAFGVAGQNEDELVRAIQADPEAAIKLKQIELDHKQAIANMETQIRLGAYDREKSIVESTHQRDWVLDILAIGTVTGFFLLAILIFLIKVDPSMNGIVNFVFGEISSMAALVLSYYFGATFKQQFSTSAVLSNQLKPVVLPPPAQTK